MFSIKFFILYDFVIVGVKMKDLVIFLGILFMYVLLNRLLLFLFLIEIFCIFKVVESVFICILNELFILSE